MTRAVVMCLFAAALALGVVYVPATAQAEDTTSTMRGFRVESGLRPHGVGPALEGYIVNDGPLRLTNVRLRVDVLGADGTLVTHASGWVFGDVTPGGRGYFLVPISAVGASYRVTVLSFDVVSGGS